MSMKYTKKHWADLLHRHMSVYSTQKIFAVQYVSEIPLVPKIQAVKIEQLKKKSVLIVQRTFFSNIQV